MSKLMLGPWAEVQANAHLLQGLREAEAGLVYALEDLANRGGCRCVQQGFRCSVHTALDFVRDAIAKAEGKDGRN